MILTVLLLMLLCKGATAGVMTADTGHRDR